MFPATTSFSVVHSSSPIRPGALTPTISEVVRFTGASLQHPGDDQPPQSNLNAKTLPPIPPPFTDVAFLAACISAYTWAPIPPDIHEV